MPNKKTYYVVVKIHCSIKCLYFVSNYITELYDQPNRPENLEVEPKQEIDVDEKGPYILQSEVEKAIKEKRHR
jgi:hypothetical protein